MSFAPSVKPFTLAEAIHAASREIGPETPLSRMYATLTTIAQQSDDRLDLLKGVRRALDSGHLFVTKGEGRESAIALLDKLNEEVGDPRSDAVRKAQREGGGE